MFMDKDQIKAVRESLGLKQGEFARLFDVHPMTVSRWERGVIEPSPLQRNMISQFGKAAKTKAVKNSSIADLLVGAGVVAVIALLLKHLLDND